MELIKKSKLYFLFFGLFAIKNVMAYELILQFQGAPKQAYKESTIKWHKIDKSGIAVFYAGKETYSDNDGQAVLAVPMPTLKKFDLVLGKNLQPVPIVGKTVDHISIFKDSIKDAQLYTFSCQEVEVPNQTDPSAGAGTSSIPPDPSSAAAAPAGGAAPATDAKPDDKKDAPPAKVKKQLWSCTKGTVPDDGKLNNNTVIILIDAKDVVVPMNRFYNPSDNPSVFLPTFFLVDRDKSVDIDVLQSFSRVKPNDIPMGAVYSLETFVNKEVPQPKQNDLNVKVKQMDESVQE